MILHPEDVAELTRVVARIVTDRLPSQSTRLLTVDQVAKLLGVSRRWLERHIEELPERVDLFGSPRWREEDIEKWKRSLPRYGKNA